MRVVWRSPLMSTSRTLQARSAQHLAAVLRCEVHSNSKALAANAVLRTRRCSWSSTCFGRLGAPTLPTRTTSR